MLASVVGGLDEVVKTCRKLGEPRAFINFLLSQLCYPRPNSIMAKKSKLLAALDAHKGKDYKLEKQKALRKKAARRKAVKESRSSSADENAVGDGNQLGNGVPEIQADSEGWESDNDAGEPHAVCTRSGQSLC